MAIVFWLAGCIGFVAIYVIRVAVQIRAVRSCPSHLAYLARQNAGLRTASIVIAAGGAITLPVFWWWEGRALDYAAVAGSVFLLLACVIVHGMLRLEHRLVEHYGTQGLESARPSNIGDGPGDR